MKVRFGRRAAVAGLVAAGAMTAWTATGLAGAEALSGRITADGSSTVGPYVQAAAESFRKKYRSVRITVGISGTGGGFERFCRDETDLSNASRPMKQSEAAKCRSEGVEYSPFLVANDGISLVINKRNTWANCLTVAELKKIWEPGSKINNWNQVRDGFPNVKLTLYGAGTDSGTFEFFTERINGKARASRSDYSATEDDNVTVRGVSSERGALGYFGYSYYIENKSKLKLMKVNNGAGCVAPSVASVRSYTYKPLSRPLFVYAKRDSFRRAEVKAFIKFMITNEAKIAKTARFISLTKKQASRARTQYNNALKLVR